MQAPATSRKSGWTTRWRCSRNSFAPRSSIPTPPPCAAWKGVSPNACRSTPATGARSRAARARSANGSRASSSSAATSRRAGWTCRTTRPASGPPPRRPPGHGGRAAPAADDSPLPQDDDERFIVGLVLTYYRRHPQRARTRLLDLLGEVLMQPAAPAPPGKPPREAGARRRRLALAALPDRRRAAEAQALSRGRPTNGACAPDHGPFII